MSDLQSAEPVTAVPASDTGTLVLRRTSSSGSISVELALAGPAKPPSDASPDYGLSGDISGTTVSFSPGQTTRTIVVQPLFDQQCELTETVIVRILPDLSGHTYAPGDPDEATVSILNSAVACTKPTISISIVDGNLNETGLNPGKLSLQRSTGNTVAVGLAFSGAATFGVDYVVKVNGVDYTGGDVNFPPGELAVDLDILPIPDSRAEGNEALTVTVLPSPDGAYSVGTPFSQPMTITDDDSIQIPLNGWALIGVYPQYVTAAYGSGINTLPDGSGGWRGQAVGSSSGYYGNSQTNFAFKWNNGSVSLLRWPASYDCCWASKWSVANWSTTIIPFLGDDYYLPVARG